MNLLLVKSSKHFKVTDLEAIIPLKVPVGLSETEEAKAFAWKLGNLEVHSHPIIVQVVVVPTINFRPRVFSPIV